MSGIMDGISTGAPICALVRNSDAQSSDYSPDVIRPGHADYTARIKFGSFADYRGGGHFSGRLTAAFVLAGAICRQTLEKKGITLNSRIVQIGRFQGDPVDSVMRKEILDARAAGDSIGSVIECVAEGVPAGTGGLMFGGLESRMSMLFFAIPGVKGVEFGAGFSLAAMRGSAANDPIRVEDGRVVMESNNAGGINGGLANGMPIIARLALRPTPSIPREQRSVNLETMENTTVRVVGRHDPCLAPRVLPVAEAAMAFCILDALSEQ